MFCEYIRIFFFEYVLECIKKYEVLFFCLINNERIINVVGDIFDIL